MTATTFPPSRRGWSHAADLADGAYASFESEPGPGAEARAFPDRAGDGLRRIDAVDPTRPGSGSAARKVDRRPRK